MTVTKTNKIAIIGPHRSADLAGEYFDIRDFHSVVLENGPVPLRILESLVDDWIRNHHRSHIYQDTDPELDPETDPDCLCPPNAVVSAKCPPNTASSIVWKPAERLTSAVFVVLWAATVGLLNQRLFILIPLR